MCRLEKALSGLLFSYRCCMSGNQVAQVEFDDSLIVKFVTVIGKGEERGREGVGRGRD